MRSIGSIGLLALTLAALGAVAFVRLSRRPAAVERLSASPVAAPGVLDASRKRAFQPSPLAVSGLSGAAPPAVPSAVLPKDDPTLHDPTTIALGDLRAHCAIHAKEQLDIELVKTVVVRLRSMLPVGPLADADAAKLVLAYRTGGASERYALNLLFMHLRDDRLVDPIFEHREDDRRFAGDCLQALASEKSCARIEEMFREEPQGLLRLKLLENIAQSGAPLAGERLLRLLDEGQDQETQERIVACLGNVPTEPVKRALLGIVDSATEDARAPSRAVREEAVGALLRIGDQGLTDRLFRSADASVAAMVEASFGQVRLREFVPLVIQRMVDRGAVSDSLLVYLATNARADDRPEIERLEKLKLTSAQREQVERLVRGLQD